MGAAGDGVHHTFGVAVVGGDDPATVLFFEALPDSAEALVDLLDRFDGRFETAGVAHHVGVGEVHDDDVEVAFAHGVDDDIGDTVGAHFGLQIVGRDLGGRHHFALFAGEGLFDATVKEVRHVGVLFGLGDTEILPVELLANVAHDVDERLAGENGRQVEALVVLGHGGELQVLRGEGPGRNFEGLADESFGQFAATVGPVVEEEAGVVVADKANWFIAAIHDGDGLDEFVGLAEFVGSADDFHGISGLQAFAENHGVEGGFNPLPALVAIHGIEAAGDGGDLAETDLVELLLEGFDVSQTAVRRGVAAIHKGVDEHVFKLFALRHAHDGIEMFGEGVHAAIADEAHDVETAALSGMVHEDLEDGVIVDFARRDHAVDTGHIHLDDAAGTDVEVADFGVAHLAIGQTDVLACGVDEGVREVTQERVVGWFFGLGDGVACDGWGKTPTVEDREDQRFVTGHFW